MIEILTFWLYHVDLYPFAYFGLLLAYPINVIVGTILAKIFARITEDLQKITDHLYSIAAVE